MAERLLAKYWKGWINSRSIPGMNGQFEHIWTTSARDAESNGMELVVFAIPVNSSGMADPQTVEQIEKLLQDKFD